MVVKLQQSLLLTFGTRDKQWHVLTRVTVDGATGPLFHDLRGNTETGRLHEDQYLRNAYQNKKERWSIPQDR